MEDKKYYDEDDIERSLSWMIKNRPRWAESRLAFYARQFPLRDAEIEELKKLRQLFEEQRLKHLAEIKQLKQDCKNLVEVNNNQMDYTKSRDIEIEELKMEDKIIGLTKSIRDHNDELSFGTIRTLEMIDDVSRSHETEIKLLKKRTRKYCDMINDRDAEIEEALETIIEYSSGMFV